jgi:hypothetical protein
MRASASFISLRGLDGDGPDADPPPRAAGDAPDERHRQDHQQDDAVDRPGAPVHAPVVERHGEEHSDASRRQPRELPHHERRQAHHAGLARRAVHAERPEADDGQRQDRQLPLEVRDQTAVNPHRA